MVTTDQHFFQLMIIYVYNVEFLFLQPSFRLTGSSCPKATTSAASSGFVTGSLSLEATISGKSSGFVSHGIFYKFAHLAVKMVHVLHYALFLLQMNCAYQLASSTTQKATESQCYVLSTCLTYSHFTFGLYFSLQIARLCTAHTIQLYLFSFGSSRVGIWRLGIRSVLPNKVLNRREYARRSDSSKFSSPHFFTGSLPLRVS